MSETVAPVELPVYKVDIRFFISALLLLILSSSCVPHEKLVNFNQGPEFPTTPEAITGLAELRIQPDDQLNIVVSAQNPASNEPYPFSISSTSGGGDQQSGADKSAYIVDKNGTIDFPGLGTISLGGLTLETARDTLRGRLLKYLTDPTVSVRFLNFKYTILGEVSRPATYTQPDISINILEAIGQAGDVTAYGSREDILIIREQDGYREFGRVNLRDRNIFKSPYFYLRQNDVIYVAPTKNKTATVTDRATRIVSFASAGIAVLNLIVILARI